MKIEQYSRLINHRISTSGQKFSVPTSNDHTDETWLATDLYIGEIGINVSDDTIYFRSNNGIVQISASSSGPSQSAIWVTSGSNIAISSTYSADAVIANSLYYTDLGNSTTRWKDLYLGGSSTGNCGINVNNGLTLTQASSEGILTSGMSVNDNAPIKIFATSSTITKDRPLHLNSRDSYIRTTTGQVATIASNGVIIQSGVSDYLVAGQNVIIATNSTSGAHLGNGYNKLNEASYQVVVGGSLAIRGMADDGSGQYNNSDFVTSQSNLRTFDALYNTIKTINWYNSAIGGEVIQVKAYIIGTKIDDASKVYSAELLGTFNIDAALTATQVGSTIRHEISNYSSCEAIFDYNSSGVDIKCKGVGTDTIQWLCTYSYHRLINII